jgi:hypothetical protein
MEFADQFLEFCTGRAWILTDVGSRSNEPIYGFSHRTFLEFFAAEYLVRTYHSPEGLWNILGPHLASGDWDSVAQIAVHLFDRSFEDGGQILLGLVVTGNSYTGIQKRNIQEFAIRALSELSVPPKVASAIQAFASNEEPISD